MLSIVVPVYNEEENIREFHIETVKALQQLAIPFEFIYVDDGSVDNSFGILQEIFNNDERVKIIKFTRNFGKSSALTAGFNESNGEFVVTLDADLQDDPKEIGNFVKKLQSEYDLICGWRTVRKDSWFKKCSSSVFNHLVNLFLRTRLHDINCGMKGYRRNVIKDLELHGSLYRFIPILAVERGFKVGEISVRHHHRKYGRSKYGIARFFEGFLDIITVFFLTRYLKKPLHFIGFGGIVFFFMGIAINFYLTFLWLQGVRPIGNRPLFFLGILFIIFGMQLFSIGLIGEMIAVKQNNEKREYNIRKRLVH